MPKSGLLLLPERVIINDLTAGEILRSVFELLKEDSRRVERYECHKYFKGDTSESNFSETAVVIENQGKYCMVSLAQNSKVASWKPYKNYVAIIPIVFEGGKIFSQTGRSVKEDLGPGYYFGNALLFTTSEGILKTKGKDIFRKVDYSELESRIRIFDSEMSLEAGKSWPQEVARTYSPTLKPFVNSALLAAIVSH